MNMSSLTIQQQQILPPSPTEKQILSELFLALLGEECVFMRLKVSGLEFRILEETTKHLHFEMTLVLEKVADIASYVRFIELFKRKRTPSTDEDSEYTPQIAINIETLECDSLKKAVSESVFNDYKFYQKMVDEMRMEHISSIANKLHSLHDVIQFALTWHKRLRFMKSFLIQLVEAENGNEFLEYLCIELTLNCSKNWEYSLMEHAYSKAISIKKLDKIGNGADKQNQQKELMHKQRLIDHLILVHTYFFMLRGDLFAELERMMQVIFIITSKYYQTPISVRKRTSNSSKMAEVIMNEALGKCSPPSNCADLMQILTSDKAPRDRNKTFYESFGLAFDAKWNNNQNNGAIALVFSKDLLRIYKKVFKILVNLQMLRFQMDEISLRFTHKICPKIKKEYGNPERKFAFFIHFNLQNVRQCLTRLVNYFFEDVLLQETSKILSSIKKEMNFEIAMLNRIVRAFGLSRQNGHIFDAIMAAIKANRYFVNSVEDFCDSIDGRNEEKSKQSPAQIHPKLLTIEKFENAKICLKHYWANAKLKNNSIFDEEFRPIFR